MLQKYREMSELSIRSANIYYKPQSSFGRIFLAPVLYASLMCSGILPTIPDDHIFKKIYDFNFDSSGLPETDLLRFILVGLEIFDLYCESSFTFCWPALAGDIAKYDVLF